MKRPLFNQLNGFKMPIFLLVSFFVCQAHADIYKCTYLDDAKRAKTVYTDVPCSKTAKKSLSDVKVSSEEKAKKSQLIGSKNLPKHPVIATLNNTESTDQAVTRAVLAGDFKLAKQLATTKEHWRLIAIAEKPDTTSNALPKLEQTVYSQNNVNPCEQAKANFESTSRLHWRDKDLINTKRSLMYASCGIAEPIQPNTIVTGQSYPLGFDVNNGQSFAHQYGGGITTSRWIAPNAYGFAPYPHQPRPHHEHHHGAQYAPQGLSIRYQNRNFGVQFGSFSSSASTFSNISGFSNTGGW